jgi:hypothetical protein
MPAGVTWSSRVAASGARRMCFVTELTFFACDAW